MQRASPRPGTGSPAPCRNAGQHGGDWGRAKRAAVLTTVEVALCIGVDIAFTEELQSHLHLQSGSSFSLPLTCTH